MAIYDGDQPTGVPMIVNGVHVNASAAVLKAASPAGTIFTFTANYSYVQKGQHLQFRRGASYALDAALKAALLAASAPMVAA